MVNSPQSKRSGPPIGRRALLAGVGATTAGAVTLGSGRAFGAVAADQAVVAATPADRFGRMFPEFASFVPANDRVRAALIDMGKVGGIMDAKDNLAAGPVALITDPALSANNPDNTTQTAGTTFVGQFLDHDMTFDETSPLGVPTDPGATRNTRTPALDLDSVYGGGPAASPQLYQAGDPVKLRVDRNGRFEDIPRNGNAAILGDRRNDENLMLTGMHAAMLLFHNNVVDRLRSQGVAPSALFDQARQQVMWHYQWMIVHEYLPQIIGQSMVNDILSRGRQYYRPEPGPAFIPVEFQGAAFRFGHSQIRPSYRANLRGNPDGSAFFGMIFDPAAEGQADPIDMRANVRAPRRFIDWQTFFNFGDGEVRRNKLIDRKISTPLFRLPLGTIASGDPPISLPQRNLLRQLTWSMPAGQLIAQKLRAPVLQLHELAHYGLALENQTPLWYYTLAEAEIVNGGRFLGPVGGRIVGEVFIGLMQLDPRAYLRVNPQWRPTLGRTAGQFGMVDLLTFAGVDPASRARQP